MMLKRVLPILCLFVLSPLVAEYLSGSLPSNLIVILPLMAAMYGSAAVLIREAAVRTGGGWPMIALLATAYGFVEEGWVDQSLFNPNYQNLRLLDFGYVPVLGTGLPWMLFVVAIHVVWSIGTPIALTNALFPERRERPFLAWWGIALFALIYLAADALVANYSYSASHFMATPGELAWSGGVILALICAAWLVTRRAAPEPSGDTPSLPVLFGVGFVPGMTLTVLMYFGRSELGLSWPAAVALMLLIGLVVVGLLMHLERQRWSDRQHLALTAGLLAVYAIGGFYNSATMHGRGDLAGHTVIAALCLGTLALAWRRARADHQGISLPS